jgi:hypothetical protein
LQARGGLGPSLATFVTTANDAGAGSMRTAIAMPTRTGTDTIVFNIAGAGVRTINLASALPTITGAVMIDLCGDRFIGQYTLDYRRQRGLQISSAALVPAASTDSRLVPAATVARSAA